MCPCVTVKAGRRWTSPDESGTTAGRLSPWQQRRIYSSVTSGLLKVKSIKTTSAPDTGKEARSQDKGFHLENALLHVFTRSLPLSSPQVRTVEEVAEGDRVQYNIPAELSDYTFREFLSSGSVHPVRLVQEYLLEGLAETWSVSMTTETLPFLLTAKRLQKTCGETDGTHCYRIHDVQKDLSSWDQTSSDEHQDQCDEHTHIVNVFVPSNKEETRRSNGAEGLRPACPLDVDPGGENAVFVLRPSLYPQIEELLTKEKDVSSDGKSHKESSVSAGAEEDVKEEPCGSCNGFTTVLLGTSGLVFRNAPISPWGLPAFHEILLTGVFPSENEPIRMLGQRLETLLAPYGVSLVTEQEDLCLTAQPMGTVGKMFTRSSSHNPSHIRVSVSLNLDLLAVLLFSVPEWRLLWSRDPRFLKQFALRPPPGKPFQPFSLFPEHFTFDISFWTGLTWEERRFHTAVRVASRGTVKQIKLMDTFSHPDLSQTSYCYRLTYQSHTHALSHTQALLLHKHLETLLSARMEVTIR
ncbi:ferredoxin-fold anticodon-binding domain-containing protein 1 isoform X2 [Genypterus blacodes]|uniref:ferredoxin-fold anticodon-binding domain-containing protein 1 isoform X2 n=1 Tax=Genypterus blacodes TaxID=154954 RepID=UPI003F76DAF4